MASKNQIKFRKCYNLFSNAFDNNVNISKSDIMQSTTWKSSTFNTYYAKKWKNNILKKVNAKEKIYEVIDFEKYDEESFTRMMSQNLSSSTEPFSYNMSETVKELLEKSNESAFLALDIYNRPQTKFRSSGYIVMMIIAWTSLIHAYFENEGIDYFYKEDSGSFIMIDGDKKAWELSTCLKNTDILSIYAKENLEFLIKIRNKIEHRNIPILDLDLCGYCQACLLNYEKTVSKVFGKIYSLNSGLAMPLQVTSMTEEQYRDAKKEFHTENYQILKNYIDSCNALYDNNTLSSDEYCFKVYLIPKIGNHRSTSDMAIEFIQFKNLNEEELKQKDRNIALIKEKQVPVINMGLYLLNQVVKKINEALDCGFTIIKRTKMWKKFNVRTNKDITDTRSCFYNTTHGYFVYTEEWIKFLIKILKDNHHL